MQRHLYVLCLLVWFFIFCLMSGSNFYTLVTQSIKITKHRAVEGESRHSWAPVESWDNSGMPPGPRKRYRAKGFYAWGCTEDKARVLRGPLLDCFPGFLWCLSSLTPLFHSISTGGEEEKSQPPLETGARGKRLKGNLSLTPNMDWGWTRWKEESIVKRWKIILLAEKLQNNQIKAATRL